MLSRIHVCSSLRLVLYAIVFVLLGFQPLLAQVDTGSIVGAVADSSGGRIPGAKVTVTEESTGVAMTVTSNPDGSYILSPLKLGHYTLTVVKEGFKTTTQQHIEVTIQSRLEVNPTLEVGAVSENVQVSSETPILETQSSSIQQLVDTRSINDLPLNRRNASFLAQLSPGVTFAQNDGRNLQASGSFTSNGMDRTQNDYLLDGMDNNAAIGDLVNQAQYVVMPPPDALLEFTVQTNNYSAEFGHSAGAVLNVVTKSGTNKWHGDLWEFLRNDAFDARDYFATTNKPEFRFNQFGGSIGGPLTIPHVYNGKDRTFFFFDYQGTRQVQGQTQASTVPTAAEQASGFTNLNDLIPLQVNSDGSYSTTTDGLGRKFPKGTVMDPASTRAITKGTADPVTGLIPAANGWVRDPFYNGSLLGMTDFSGATARGLLNGIPANRLSSVAVGLLKLYPTPTSSAITKNYVISPPNTTFLNSIDFRLDQNFSQRDHAFVRYSLVNSKQHQGAPLPGVADGTASRPGSGKTQSQNAALSWTHQLSQHLVNEARVGYSRVYDKRLQVDSDVMGIPDKYGIPGVPQIAENGGLPLFQFGQLSNLGASTTNPSDKASDVLQVTDNISIDKDRHSIRTGFEYQHIAFPMATPTQPRGAFTYSGIFTSVVGITDGSTDRAQLAIQPIVSTYGQLYNYIGGANTVQASSFPPVYYPQRQYLGIYAQDSWRATSNLTVNWGVRYEFIGDPAEKTGRVANFVSAQTGDSPDGLSHYYIPARTASQLTAAMITLLTANNVVVTQTPDNLIGLSERNDLAPRVGFAYQPTPKMSVRGGYGMFYQGNENHGLSTSPYVNFPFQVSASYTNQSAEEGIIADKVNDQYPEGTVGPIDQGLKNISLSPANATVSSISFNGEPRHPKTTYSQAYNLQVQYQIAPTTVVFAGFVGGGSKHVLSSMNLNSTNQIVPSTTALSSVAFFKTLATGGTYIGRNGFAEYNSLQFGAERRMSHGFAFLANMTWGKCLGNVRDLLDNGVGGYRAPYVAGFGTGADYSYCGIDVRRIVHTAGTYEVPFGHGKSYFTHGAAAWLAGGWSANWIFTVQDGQPLNIACATAAPSGLGCNALKAPGVNPYGGSHNVTQYLNPDAFLSPPVIPAGQTGTIANLGGTPAQVHGPPFRRLDLSIFRRFPFIHESYFEFRGEVFNVTNTPNFGQPTQLNYTTKATFSQITATRDSPNDPREIQLSMKYYF